MGQTSGSPPGHAEAAGLIEAWHERRLTAGSHIDDAISAKLDNAEVILLLSPDFLASEYSWGVEIKRAMERHESDDSTIIPAILQSCEWHRAPSGKLLAAPKDGKPIRAWADRDAAFLDVARQVRRLSKVAPRG